MCPPPKRGSWFLSECIPNGKGLLRSGKLQRFLHLWCSSGMGGYSLRVRFEANPNLKASVPVNQVQLDEFEGAEQEPSLNTS